MIMNLLDSDDIAQVVLTVATPNALCNILRNHKDVEAVRRYLFDNADDARQLIEEYVRERIIDLNPRTHFQHEAAFCALAVALETLPMPASENFLSELAALKIAEMPISPRVARLCIERRKKLLIFNTISQFNVRPIPNNDVSLHRRTSRVLSGLTDLDRRPRLQTGITYQDTLQDAA
uniref:Uncharacterized protein n=1 Tax=Desulfobacca acetoxidans TaxID=60893 RepID=A0A7V4G6C3_9BACT